MTDKIFSMKTRNVVFENEIDFPLRVNGNAGTQGDMEVHGHEFSELTFILAGTGTLTTPAGELELSRGDIVLTPPGGRHGYENTRELHLRNLLFDMRNLPLALLELYNHPAYKQIFLSRHEKDAPERQPPCLSLIEEDFSPLEMMIEQLAQRATGYHCFKLGLLMAILSRLCDLWLEQTPSLTGGRPADINRVITYMNNNFTRKINLDHAAKHSGMSRSSLHRHFILAMGVPPVKYLTNLRLHCAAELLLNTDFKMEEIAERSGFQNIRHFFHTFKKAFNTSPGDYRKLHTQTRELV